MSGDIELKVILPQFRREEGDPKPADRPPENFDDLRQMDVGALKEMGLRPWNRANETEDVGHFPKNTVLYLLPGEWYPYIPEGTKLVGIMGGEESFKKGETDDDIRFGCLPYGILVKVTS